MKVVYVIDSISDLNNKINLLKIKYGDNIFYVVRADLVELFKAFGYYPNAVYYKNLTEIIHTLLINSNQIDDVIICYASLKFNMKLLTEFTNQIGSRTKVVSLTPKYNAFERMCNSAYNLYVKSIFKAKDSMVSPKLQFIPGSLLVELLSTHLGNRLFEMDEDFKSHIQIEDDEINKSAKTKVPVIKFSLIACLITLIITVGLLASIAYYKASYVIILLCAILYILNITLSLIFLCKVKFDNRFLK